MSMLEYGVVHARQPTLTHLRSPHQPLATSSSSSSSLINVAAQPLHIHHSSLPTSVNKFRKLRMRKRSGAGGGMMMVKATSVASSERSAGGGSGEMREVKAVVTIVPNATKIFQEIVSRVKEDIADLLGKSLLLELLSSEVDSESGLEKPKISAYAHKTLKNADNHIIYEAEFLVPEDFGTVGAILVENEHHKEMFLKDIQVIGLDDGAPTFHSSCGSWVHSKFDNPIKRIFFNNKPLDLRRGGWAALAGRDVAWLAEREEALTADLLDRFGWGFRPPSLCSQSEGDPAAQIARQRTPPTALRLGSYLPCETPEGLKEYRKKELALMRGFGIKVREAHDRIYDYDVYNDLGDPDSDLDLLRSYVRNSKQRCVCAEDESFSGVKQLSFAFNTVSSVLHAIVPTLQTYFIDSNLPFPFFTAIDKMYNEGINIPELPHKSVLDLFPRLMKAVTDLNSRVICFETPAVFEKDKFSWFRDDEFARQLLAGINPHAIRRVTEWPLKSNLDPEIYGSAESSITTELVEKEIKGLMTVEEAMEQKRLYVLDYHDIFIPYVSKVRELENTTLYGSRTLFLLTQDNILKVVAIELTRPKSDTQPQWRQVFTPGWDATSSWLWRMAKAHVLAQDSGYHQLVSHWLRTHCCTELYIIATNRQLSAMHPIYRLIDPHFRYTMEINALAREALINAGGIIESCFSPGKYSIELSSAAYDLQWQFNTEALPEDLISRGLAEKDEAAPHGLRLFISDFPYANDGLLIWDSIKQWVSDYVNYYYPDPKLVETDEELQAWWTEIRTEGHGDKKDEPWWPVLKTPKDLIQIITTIVWVTSGHHAAVNFGQYDFAGQEWKEFVDKPEIALLHTFPSQAQASKVMAVLDVISTHSPDEEYMGEHMEAAWKDDPEISAAFERFRGRLMEIEGIIDSRNLDPELKNRHGAGVVPYQLLKPFSEPGVTMKGIPYSISI
uniref:Lipoxygenase n=1 Tax=Kalanchoe fedtschenkoi TaxID=63787 RepID=A0A7N0VBI2_KALFE